MDPLIRTTKRPILRLNYINGIYERGSVKVTKLRGHVSGMLSRCEALRVRRRQVSSQTTRAQNASKRSEVRRERKGCMCGLVASAGRAHVDRQARNNSAASAYTRAYVLQYVHAPPSDAT